jgi:hypothetical protein
VSTGCLFAATVPTEHKLVQVLSAVNQTEKDYFVLAAVLSYGGFHKSAVLYNSLKIGQKRQAAWLNYPEV